MHLSLEWYDLKVQQISLAAKIDIAKNLVEFHMNGKSKLPLCHFHGSATEVGLLLISSGMFSDSPV